MVKMTIKEYYNEFYKNRISKEVIDKGKTDICDKVDKYIIPLAKDKDILEIGCGYGCITNYINNKASAEGCDLSDSLINAARTYYPKTSFFIHDIEEKPTEKIYDIILLCDVLEHIFDYDKALINIHKSLNENGLIFIHVPHLLGLKHRFQLLFGNTNFFENKSHIRYYSDKFLKNLLIKHGFKIIKVIGFGKFKFPRFCGTIAIIARKKNEHI